MPLKGCHKLNVDASRIAMSNNGTIGGVIKDDKGKIAIEYAMSVGTLSVLVAECRAICEGNRIARNTQICNIEVESDVIPMMRATNGKTQCPCLIITLVQDIW